eukprot:scaffold9903_cov30-Tisochrysis_lutea.AAC.13
MAPGAARVPVVPLSGSKGVHTKAEGCPRCYCRLQRSDSRLAILDPRGRPQSLGQRNIAKRRATALGVQYAQASSRWPPMVKCAML